MSKAHVLRAIVNCLVLLFFAIPGAFVLGLSKPFGIVAYVATFLGVTFVFGEISWHLKNWIHSKIK